MEDTKERHGAYISSTDAVMSGQRGIRAKRQNM